MKWNLLDKPALYLSVTAMLAWRPFIIVLSKRVSKKLSFKKLKEELSE